MIIEFNESKLFYISIILINCRNSKLTLVSFIFLYVFFLGWTFFQSNLLFYVEVILKFYTIFYESDKKHFANTTNKIMYTKNSFNWNWFLYFFWSFLLNSIVQIFFSLLTLLYSIFFVIRFTLLQNISFFQIDVNLQ